MQTYFDRVLISLVDPLDQCRASILRVTLKIPIFKKIFCNRADRLFVLYCGVATLNLFLALLFPLWVLIVGPFIYGVPHILSSIRYVHYSIPIKSSLFSQGIGFFSSIFVLIAVFRILIDIGTFQPEILNFDPLAPEWFSFLLTFIGCIWIYGKNLKQVFYALLFAVPLLVCAWAAPLWTSGAMILLHNFVGFYYWIVSAKSQRERNGALLSTFIFCCVHILIFIGFFDGIYHYISSVFTPAAQVSWARMDYGTLGRMIAPWSDSYIVWFHCVVAYAFGQSVHYFVWLKAIPDQHHYHEIPTSFRQSYRFLVSDFGWKYLFSIGLVGIAILGIALFLNYPQARVIYFAIASYHGFLELAGLGYVSKKVLA